MAPAGAGNAVGGLEEMILLGSTRCHALVYVRILRHIFPASRRFSVPAVRARNRRRAHERQSQ